LTLSSLAGVGAGGTGYTTYEFTNHGDTTCAMTGCPGFAVLNSEGAIVQISRAGAQYGGMNLCVRRPKSVDVRRRSAHSATSLALLAENVSFDVAPRRDRDWILTVTGKLAA
jgi:hypothetical protein